MKIYKYLILIISTIALGSCDSFLDAPRPSAFDAEYVFSNLTDAEKMINGVYACFPVDPYTSRMSNVFMQNTDVEATAVSENPDGSRRDVWSLQGSRLVNFADIQTCWNNCYLAIDRANQCIEGILASELYKSGDPTMKQFLGEAYCLRAYWYWMMCNYWGDVPLALEASKEGMNLNTPRVDKNIIYSQIIQDIINVEEGMFFAEKSSAGIEKMNREFALGFIARLAMFRAGYGTTYDGKQQRADDYMTDLPAVNYTYDGAAKTARTSTEYYQLAKDYCQKLIALSDRPLNPDFRSIFMNQCKFIAPKKDDILFEIAFLQNNGGDVGWCIGLSVDGGAWGSGGSYIKFPATYYYSFDDKDLRLNVTCSLVKYETDVLQKMNDINATDPSKWCRLWLNSNPGSSSSKATGINWPVMRYSDVLLMLAEAENEINGPTAVAQDALKRVRNRAFAAGDRTAKVDQYVAGVSGSKKDFFEAIVDERAWEFGGECIRKFDLIRWGNYGEKIVKTRKELTNMGLAANDQNLSDPEVAKYKDLAKVLYYQINNGIITIMNPRYAVSEPANLVTKAVNYTGTGVNDAWAAHDWTKALVKDVSGTFQPADFITRSWRGYTDETGISPVPYLLPIHYNIVSKSNGVLSNKGYGLGLTL